MNYMLIFESSCWKDFRSGASATAAGNEFHILIDAGKKPWLRVSVIALCCLNAFLLTALVLQNDGRDVL
jgi:hypothetical protein